MHRTGLKAILAVTVCLALAGTAMAQGQGRGRGGRGGFGGFGGPGGGFGMGASMLLRNEDVQKELKLTDDQLEKLKALNEAGGGRGRRGGNFQDMSEEERAKAFAEFQKEAEERNKKAEAVLTADQAARLKQISLQVRGNTALAEETVAKELKLSEDQVSSVKTILEESGKRMRELFQPGGDREEMRKQMTEIREATNEELLAVLSDEQKAKLAEMKGPKINFEINPFGRGGPGGGPGGGRRRGGNNN